MKKRRIKNALSDLFESPDGIFPDGWSVLITDGAEAYVTGCRAILSYDESAVTVDAGDATLRITGEHLDIARYTDREIVVRGNVSGFSTETPC